MAATLTGWTPRYNSAMPTDTDALLADLLEKLTDSQRRGERVDLAEEIRLHPDLAGEIRELWATVQIADEFASGDPLGDPLVSDPADLASSVAPRWFGDYELLEELGRGGMGVVYRARQLSLGRVVALKLILRGEFASAAEIGRFRVEAAAGAQVEHPHIVPVYEVGEVDGQPFFTMKYIAGTTLSRKLAEGPLPARDTAELMLPVCLAIADAHQRGVVHRDLKPSNILIDQQGQPHVSDFGLAKRLNLPASVREVTPSLEELQREGDSRSLTHTGDILGTPSYISPEQAAGNRGEVGPASDVYSLGAILYQCLTGRPPFQAASPVDVLLMVLDQDPLLPRVVNPRADADLEMITLKCLQKPADLRYDSAAALADDLRAFLASEPIAARSTNIGQLFSRLLRETHHAAVLENWGLLWMWHSLVLLVLCVITNILKLNAVTSFKPYLAVWIIGLGAWAAAFWALRRRAGLITFVERQIAHIWAGSVICSCMLFLIEIQLKLEVLQLSPVLGLISGMVFLCKAGILTGAFYVQALALFVTAIVMARFPDYGISIFGIVSAVSFFVPGLKYYRQRRVGRPA